MKSKPKGFKPIIKRPVVVEPLESRVLYSSDLGASAIVDTDPVNVVTADSFTLPFLPLKAAGNFAPAPSAIGFETPNNHKDEVSKAEKNTLAMEYQLHDVEANGLDTISTPLQVTEIIFVEAGLPDTNILIDDILSTRESSAVAIIKLVVDSDQSGLEQVSSALGKYRSIESVHFVTHGTNGSVHLGDTRLTAQTIGNHADELASWSEALTEDADILFYGCDLAATDEGRSFVDLLSALTLADVAASDDLTGHSALGGDWDLEYTVGSVETGVAFSLGAQQNWFGTLQTITVTSFDDVVNGNTSSINNLVANDGGDGISLREAIIAANASTADDQILLDSGTYLLTLSGAGTTAGDLDIQHSLQIVGVADGSTIIDGTLMNDRVFHVNSNDLTLRNLTITGGATAETAGGGGILVGSGTTAVFDSVIVTGNTATTGGGIQASGSVVASGSTFSNNTATADGGGIALTDGRSTLTSVTISENSSTQDGGGLYVSSSTGIHKLTNVTVSGNDAQRGGGIHTEGGQILFNHGTVTNNSSSTDGGGIYRSNGIVVLENSIVAGNSAQISDQEIQGAVSSAGINIIGDDAGDAAGGTGYSGSDLVDETGLSLGPLVYNGGATNTHELQAGSVGIDGTASTTEPVDGRGFYRNDGASDIGAFEVGATPNLEEDLVAHFEFEENGGLDADDSAIGNTGNIVNGGIWTTDSAVGSQALDLSSDVAGLNSYVSVPDNPLYDFGNGEFTVSLWYNMLTPIEQVRLVGNLEAVSSNTGFSLRASPAGEFILSRSDGGTEGLSYGTGIMDGQWHQLTVAVDAGGGTRLYVDGVETTKLTGSFPAININTNDPLLIGALGSTTGDFEGKLDDVRLYSRALDASEASQLAAGVNSAPTFVTLDDVSAFTEGDTAPVRLDADVTVFDQQLSLANDFGGASLTLERTGGGNTDDNFHYMSGSNLTFAGGNIVELSGVQKGSYTFISGTLMMTFDAGTTNADVNEIMQSIGYRNFSNNPPASVVIEWTFDDGNTGAQGFGGSLQATASSLVAINSVNDAPLLDLDADNSSGGAGLSYNGTFTEDGGPVNITDLDAILTDVDDANLTGIQVQIINQLDGVDERLWANPGVTGLTVSYNTGTGILMISGSATVAEYEQVLRTITYDNLSESPDTTQRTLNASVSDASSNSLVAQSRINVIAVNDAPVFVSLPDASGQTVDSNATGASSATTADIDGDGTLDLVTTAANSGEVIWYQGDGAGNFGVPIVVTSALIEPKDVVTADLDADGDIDIVAADYNTTQGNIVILTNDGSGNFSQLTLETVSTGIVQVETGDIDGDGDFDIAANFWFTGETVWYDNVGGNNWVKNVVGTGSGGTSVALADVNNDGDLDIISTYRNTNELVWFENNGAAAGFTAHAYTVQSAFDSVATDLDNDGDIDLGYIGLTGTLGWLESDGALIPSFTDNRFSPNFGKPSRISAADIDGDGDQELMVAFSTNSMMPGPFDNQFVIFKNDGTGIFTEEIFDSGANPTTITATDLDNDLDLEILTTDSGSSDVIVYENLGNGEFARAQTFEDLSTILSPIVIDDADAGTAPLQVSIAVSFGSMSLSSTNGLIFTTGDGVEDTLATFTGSLVDINIALSSLQFNPLPNYNGEASIQITVNDQGNSGNGGAKITQEILYVDVLPVNDAPTAAAPATLTSMEQIALDLDGAGFTVGDVDSGSSRIELVFGVNEGVISVDVGDSGVSVFNSGSPMATVTGSATEINNLLSGSTSGFVQYHNASDTPSASTTLTMKVNDLGNSGSDPGLTGDATSEEISTTTIINITPVNDAPVIDLDADNSTTPGLEYRGTFVTANGPVNVVDSDTSISDPDNATLSWLVVTITNLLDGSDESLSVTLPGGTWSQFYNPTNGELSIVPGPGSTHADWEDVLESIQYDNTSVSPDLTERVIIFTGDDGTDSNSPIAESYIKIAANQAPVLGTASLFPVNQTENNGQVGVDTSITISDADSSTLTSAVVSIASNYTPGEDTLEFTSQSGISGSFNPVTGVLTLTGTASVADYQAALRTITYDNSSEAPSTLVREIEWTVNDGNNNSNVISRNVFVTPVNDAPVLDSTGNVTLTSISEDSTNNVGDTVATIIANAGGDRITDVDTSAVEGIAVIGNDDSNGSWEYSIDGGLNWLTLSNPTTSSALLLDSSALLRFEPAAGYVGPATFSFHAWDQTSGVSGATVDATTRGGTTSLSTNTDFASLQVVGVNDAPYNSGSLPANTTVVEDALSSVDLSVINFSDVDAAASNLTVTLTTATGGELTLSADPNLIFGGTPAARTISGSLIDLNTYFDNALNIRYMHGTPHTFGIGADTITLTINDNGNTGLGGGTDQTLGTVVVDIDAVNDAPSLATIEALPAFYIEGNGPLGVTGNLSPGDVDDTNIESATVSISGNFVANEDVLNFTSQFGIVGSFNATTGVLSLSGTATIAEYQTVIRSITYDNTNDNPSDLTRTISFAVNDGDTISNTLSRDIDVTRVNDAPVLATIEAIPAFYTENGTPVGITGNLAITDADNINIESATIAISGNYVSTEDLLNFTNVPGITGSYDSTSGILALSGSASPADYQSAIYTITYENTSDNPSTLNRTISISVNDGALDSNTLSRDISFIAVNDAPILSAIESAPAIYTENATPVAITGTLAAADFDDTNIESATVAITGNFANGEDVLAFTSQLGITGTYDSTAGILALNGSAAVADYQTAIQSVTYENTSDNPSDLTRTISITVNDGDSNSNTLSRNISFTAVNDAPLLSTIESAPAFYTENDAPAGLTGNLTVSDIDDNNIESATVTINSNFVSSEDVLAFTDLLGITGDYDVSTGQLTLTGSATLLDYQTALRTITYENLSDNPSTLVRAVSFTINDGELDSNTLSRDIEFTAVNDAPVLSGIETAPVFYSENELPVTITASLSTGDVDDVTIESASVEITANFTNGEDVLAFSNQLGITGNYNATSGSLTLTGSATLADYQTALQTVTYENISDNPSTLTRTVSFNVNDGELNSNTLSRDISLTAINDAPVLSNIEAQPALYIENSTPSGLTGNLVVGDIDDFNIESATVAITGNFTNGEDKLIFADQPGITGAYDLSAGVLALTGSASLADYQAAIQSIGYENTSDNPSTLTRTISFTVNDGNLDSNTLHRDIDLTAVNDAPVLSAIETAPTFYTENDIPVGLTGNLTVSDIDNATVESAAVAITGNFTTGEDVLVFTDQPGITGAYDSSTGILALTGTASLADYQTAIHTIAYENTSDDPSTLTRTVSFAVNDGDLDSGIQNRDIVFTSVNDAPVLSTIEVLPASYMENGTPIDLTDNLTIGDIDDHTIESAIVAITGNFASGEDILGFNAQFGLTGNYDPAIGVLTLTGSATSADYQAALQSVTYENTSDDPSVLTRTVSFSVYDGDDISNILSRDISVAAVNDAPALSSIESSATQYTENDLPVTLTAAISVSDVDDSNIESATIAISNSFSGADDILRFTDQSGISGSYDTSAGILNLTGAATLSDYQNAIRTVSYENTGDNPSDLTRTVSFTVNDGESSSATVSRNIEFTAVNDTPVIFSIETTPVSYTENATPVSITDNISVSDIDNNNIESASVAISSNFAAAEDMLIFTPGITPDITGSFNQATGVLTLTGSASLTDYESALRSVSYQNNSEDPTDLPRTVTFTVSDGDAISNVASRKIDFTAVNDAPALSAIETLPASFTENGLPVAVTDSVIVSDIDNTSIQSATVSITGNFLATEDMLAFSNTPAITGTYDSSTGVLTLTGNATTADYQSALHGVTYQNTSDDPSIAVREIELVINDGTLDSNPLYRDVLISPVNDRPVLSAIESSPILFNENSLAVSLTSSIELADIDNTTIESATIAIASGYSAGNDWLTFTDQSGITGNFDSTAGVLTLIGPSSLSNYENALRSVGFANGSDNPGTHSKVIDFTVNDHSKTSNTVSREIVVIASNDVPVIASLEATDSVFLENSDATPVTSTLTVTDIDDTLLEFATVTVSGNFHQGQDTLVFTDQSGITGVFDSLNGTLHLSGTATIEDYESALRSVGYLNSSDDPSTLPRTIDFSVNDGENSSNFGSRVLIVSDTNDSPYLISIESQPLDYTENQNAINITESLNILDTDDSTLEGATVLLSQNFAPDQDQLSFTSTANITGSFDNSTGSLSLTGTATLADYQAALRTVTYHNTSENPSMVPRTIDISVTDGTAQSAVVSRNLNVTSVNDAPSGSDSTIAFLEDNDYLLHTSDFGFSDPLDSHNFAGVVIEQLPARGTLLLNGINVTVGQFITIADITAGTLVFSPEPDASGTSYDNLHFKVVDDGGNDAGGIDTASNANQIDFDVISVNDPPAGTDSTVTTQEDTTHVFSRSDFGYSDVQDGNSFIAVTISTVPNNGSLTLSGIPIVAGTVIDTVDIDAGRLHYTPPQDVNGLGYNGFSFLVHDDGGNDNGGDFVDQLENHINFDVPGVNDPPRLISEVTEFDEGSENTITTDVLSATDADDLAPDDLTFTINSLPYNGKLSIDGTPVVIGNTFTMTHLLQNRLVYIHDGSETSEDAFNIQVSDGGEDAAPAASGQVNLIINEVIDPPPIITDEALLIDFGQSYDSRDGDALNSGESTLAAALVNENPRLVVSIESQPTNGTVTINSDGMLFYQHDSSQILNDSFQYRVTNEDGVFAIATVLVSIEPAFQTAFDGSTFPDSNGNVEAGLSTGQKEEEEENESAEESIIPAAELALYQPTSLMENSVTPDDSDLSGIETTDNSDSINALTPPLKDMLSSIDVIQHKKVRYTDIEGTEPDTSTASIAILADLTAANAHNVVSNERFLDGLRNINQDFQDTEEAQEKRYHFATEVSISLSFGTTAGILAWTLRGGTLFASLMASLPLWGGINPLALLSEKEKKANMPQDDVEELFTEHE